MSALKALEGLLMPPAGLFWLAFAGLALLAFRRRRAGIVLLVTSVLGLYVLSLPLTQNLFAASLDRFPALDLQAAELPPAEAVVVLTAGRQKGAREHGGESVNLLGLDRVRYAALLHRRTGQPVLITGLTAPLMADALRSFDVPVRWLEEESRDTRENAEATAHLLAGEGIRRIYLVTHFWHMPRSVAVFRARGLDVVPAPMGFQDPRDGLGWRALVPRPEALVFSNLALHEWVGRAWYGLRG